jgi:hypothetical protein
VAYLVLSSQQIFSYRFEMPLSIVTIYLVLSSSNIFSIDKQIEFYRRDIHFLSSRHILFYRRGGSFSIVSAGLCLSSRHEEEADRAKHIRSFHRGSDRSDVVDSTREAAPTGILTADH